MYNKKLESKILLIWKKQIRDIIGTGKYNCKWTS